MESDWTNDFYTLYPQVKQDYINGMKVKNIRNKYNLTEGQWIAFRKELTNDGVIKPKQSPRYYTYDKRKDRYIVQRHINGKTVRYDEYKTEKEAQQCIELLKEYHWDKSRVWEIRAKIRGEIK